MPPTIHLIAPAGNLQSFYQHLGIENSGQLLSLLTGCVGDDFRLSANSEILDAPENERLGGRDDDLARADDLTAAMANDEVTAIVALRGGAWFTRVLPRIDFRVLDRRTNPVTVLGFSELTPLVNIAAQYPMARGVLDMGPAFLVYGLQRHAATDLHLSESTNPTPQEWMRTNLTRYVQLYMQALVQHLRGEPYPAVTCHLARGVLSNDARAAFVGGNLTVLSTLVGTRYAEAVAPENHWIVLEDFNDKVERFDRFLAHFTLADYWNRCRGVLLGDFHRGEFDLLPAVLALLEHHIPNREVPILITPDIGHIWPMKPLPLNRPGRWVASNSGSFEWRCDE